MLNSRKFPQIRARQRGAAAVEFALIAVIFFGILFGILEFGRGLYVWNSVQEVTRCAARQAVVTWKGNTDDWSGTTVIGTAIPIRQYCLFGADELVAGREIQKANIQLRALNLRYDVADPNSLDNNLSNCTACPTNAYDAAKSECTNCIRFVEAKVVNAYFEPLMTAAFLGFTLPASGIQLPPSTVVMPAESLGY